MNSEDCKVGMRVRYEGPAVSADGVITMVRGIPSLNGSAVGIQITQGVHRNWEMIVLARRLTLIGPSMEQILEATLDAFASNRL